ncbi:MAG: hypothetical protein ACP5NZ_01830 [Nanobdellota archaeon]
MNLKLLLLSILALFLLILGFLWNYWFIVGAVIIVLINQRELMKDSSKKIKSK